MELQDIVRLVVFAALGFGAFYLVRRNTSTISAAGLAKLARFGLTPVDTGGRGATVAGTYSRRPCGYHWGPTATMTSAVRTRVGTITGGSEFFTDTTVEGPPLAIVQRDERTWTIFEGGLVPKYEVSTGDPEFDRRFSVRCYDPDWAQAVVSAPVRARLLSAPLVFLVHHKGQVIAPLHFDTKRMFAELGVSMSIAWSLLDAAPVFLDSAVALADSIEQASSSSMARRP